MYHEQYRKTKKAKVTPIYQRGEGSGFGSGIDSMLEKIKSTRQSACGVLMVRPSQVFHFNEEASRDNVFMIRSDLSDLKVASLMLKGI